MSESISVLVSGATERQGGAVCRKLLARGHRVRALTRRPESIVSGELQRIGADVIKGDLDDIGSIKNAMSGVDAVFAVGSPSGPGGTEAEVRQMRNIAQSAREVDMDHLVYSSVAGCDRDTGISLFESKNRIEQFIGRMNLPFTVIRPVFFMENILTNGNLPALRTGALRQALSPRQNLQQIAVADVGAFTAHVLENRKRFLSLTIEIASDELTGEECAEILTRAAGRRVTYEQMPLEEARQRQGEDYARMFEWFNSSGFRVNIPDLRRFYPEVRWHSYERWATEQDWEETLGTKAA